MLLGSGISIFAIIAIVITVLIVSFASNISTFMHAPKEAFDSTVIYIRICSAGSVFIVAYNIIGGVFRGLGDFENSSYLGRNCMCYKYYRRLNICWNI